MQSFPLSIAAFIFVLGILVFVHEFGHYAVAKLCKVRVDVFSLGFGKRLIGFRRGDTDYRISALPLGGYVKMAGESPMEARTGDPGEFMSHPRWQRLLIAIAGPAMNILLAIVLVTGVFMVHYSHEWFLDQPSRVGWVEPNSPAERAGVLPGDLIVQIDGIKNPLWEDTRAKIAINAGQPLPVLLKRGDSLVPLTITPDAYGPSRIGEAGVDPAEQITVESIEPSMPADKAGIRQSDDIGASHGVGLPFLDGLTPYLQAEKGHPGEVSA